MRICGSCGGGYIGDNCEACTTTVLCEPVTKPSADRVMLSHDVFVPNPADIAEQHRIANG